MSLDRRGFVGLAAATVATLSTRGNAMTQVLSDVAQSTSKDSIIREFRFKASDADLADLRRRVNAT